VSLSPFALRGLPDHVLLERLKACCARDAELEAELLVHLGEVDARQLAVEKGFSSLFDYCVEVLHFSESVAYQRIQVARAARRFPEILECVRSGEIHLSGLRLLVPHLTEKNWRELLDLARHESKRAIEQRLADRAPKPDVPTQLRRLPAPATGNRSAPDMPVVTPPSAPVAAPPPVLPRPEAPRPSAEPLGASRYHVQFTAGPETHAKLREAQALLRHQIPDGDLARIFDRALDALLREARRTKFAETDQPRAARAEPESQTGPASRHIPAAIRRAVATRDGERCTYVAPDGRRCAARDALEYHHVVPFARTRRHRVAEITLRCRAHNGYAARQDFGADCMARFRRDPGFTSTCPGAGTDREGSRGQGKSPDP
jgi:hypothetical protein